MLKDLIDVVIINKVDHKHLNYDVEFLRGIIPTVENLCVVFWRQLENQLPSGELHMIRLYESDQNVADYFGARVTIPHYELAEAPQYSKATA